MITLKNIKHSKSNIKHSKLTNMYQLKVTKVQELTKDAVAVSFDVPQALYEVFGYKPGQYLTLQFNLNGEQVRRSYSLCSSPVVEEPLRIGVKRVKDGLVSNHINDNVKVGDIIDVLPPDGRFYAEVDADNYKTYYLFSAGSGITPILSIALTVLYTEPHSFVHMIYGNSTQESIMFKQELDELQEQYADRFILVHSLSRPKESWFSSPEFEYRKGRVDAEAIQWFINEYPPYAQNVEYYICGPGKMIESTQKTLKGIDVPDERVYVESFGGGSVKSTVEGVENAQLSADIFGQEATATVAKGKTVLRALIDAGYDPPYSCEGGVCSTCKCKVIAGEVIMKNNMALTDKEVADGYVLSCQSVPTTAKVKVVYEG